MKGYFESNNKILYVFPQTAGEIPYVDPAATSIAIQQEDMAAWVEENSSVADLMVPYNYNMMTVQKKVWSDHLDDDIVVPVTLYDITLSGDQDLTNNLSLNKTEAPEDDAITITPAGSSYTAAWVDVTSTDASINWDASTSKWGFTMPASDVTATATPRTLYEITKSGDYTTDFTVQPSSYMPQHQHQYDSYINLIPSNGNINPNNGYMMTVVTTNSDPVTATWDWDTNKWYFAMPASDVTATMTHEVYTVNYAGDYSELIEFYGQTDLPPGYYASYPAKENVDLYNDYTCSVVDSNSNPVQLSGPTADFNTLAFNMPASDVTVTITPKAPQPTTYSFNINEEGNEFTVGSYEENDSVQYTFDHALQQEEFGLWHWEYDIVPSGLNYNFNPGQPGYIDTTDPDNPVEIPEVPAEISFTMPANDVTFTITMVTDDQSPE